LFLRLLCGLLFAVLAACAPGSDHLAARSTEAAASRGAEWRNLSVPARLLHVSEQVAPFGEGLCRSAPRHFEVRAVEAARNCTFVIALAPDPNLPANASQGVLPDGRPIVVFTSAMVARAANEHELALVLGHEMAHHIADHAPREARRIDEASAGVDRALTVEGDGSASRGAERLSPGKAGDRAFLRNFELEADQLGAEIAAGAGYDMALGVKLIGRIAGRPGEWRRRDYYPTKQAREAAVLSALSGQAAGATASFH
jgi:Zn-dependent protease with chaperone function